MDSDYSKKLETEIDGLLKGLPELEAPPHLVSRVMSRTARKTVVPWYKRSWEMWPTAVRYAALVLMLGSFGALCFASWQLTRAAGFTTAMQEIGHTFSGIVTLWNALVTVLGAIGVACRQHPVILSSCLLLLALGWSACVAVSTAFVRFAFVRR